MLEGVLRGLGYVKMVERMCWRMIGCVERVLGCVEGVLGGVRMY